MFVLECVYVLIYWEFVRHALEVFSAPLNQGTSSEKVVGFQVSLEI